MKETDEFDKLFSDFNPELKDDFMSKLTERLDAVEMVKEANEKSLRSTRRSALYAAVAGFITGVLMTLLYSRIAAAVSSIGFDRFSLDPVAVQCITWTIVAATAVCIGLATYDLTGSLISSKQK